MALYLIYINATPVALDEPVKEQELSGGHIIDVVKMGTMVPSDPHHAPTGDVAVGKV
ncbi:sugar efflux transporter SWEET11 [Sesbania bispinosa]|nr:sugar efflux transporter SWEET11 [Sesbania bispinosa]